MKYKCKECGKQCTMSTSEAIKSFPIMYQFCNGDLNNFFLLFGKGVYSYEDMDSWGKIDETTIPSKEAFYSKLNLENITDKYYECVQKIWEVF